MTVTDLPGATLRTVHVSAMDNACYLLTCSASGSQLLIDAADDTPALLSLVNDGSARLDVVVTTHRHWDHHRALPAVVAETGARTAAGADDADELPVTVDERLSHGDTVVVGDLSLDVVHLRGHTPGSVALIWRDADGGTHAFTGDSLFPGGPGRTTKPGDFNSLMDDLEARVFILPDETKVYPGHGEGTTLGTERPHLQEWRERGW
ncbi:MAG TPA: MBL fold metallo-hydrolase [Actinomycetales bacterium]|nr:MBL fold metallo-hydrolase [Actinomycetales bacterium]